MKMSDRPVEYIFFALKKRPFLLSMINNNTKFCMELDRIRSEGALEAKVSRTAQLEASSA